MAGTALADAVAGINRSFSGEGNGATWSAVPRRAAYRQDGRDPGIVRDLTNYTQKGYLTWTAIRRAGVTSALRI